MAPPLPPALLPAPKRRWILLVDDHAASRRGLQHLLETRGHLVLTAGSGAAALAIVAHVKVDLVIANICLPDGDGFTLMATLRDHYGLCGLAVTNHNTAADLARSTASGFVAHLGKPINITLLDAAIDRWTAAVMFA